jgi:hypothetical protein
MHVKDGEEPGNLDDVVDALGQVHQLELAFAIAHRGVGAHHFADAGAVDIIHVVEVQQNLALSVVQQIANGLAQDGATFAERDFAAEIYNRDVPHFPECAL